MRVVLVNPPLSGEERYGALAAGGVYLPPLGIAILAQIARDKRHDSFIIDAEAEQLTTEQTIKRLINIDPDVVGISAATVAIYSAASLAERFKKRKKSTPVIIGGPHITAIPGETMRCFPGFDIGVIGEGECALAELLDVLRDGSDLKTIAGIIFRIDGKIIETGPRELIADLDTIPFPAWDLLPDIRRRYRPSAFGFQRLPATSFVTSRGCPSRCSFCNQGPWGKKRYREHSVPYLLDMIRILYHSYGIRDLVIYDGTFGVNKERLIAFCEALIRENLNLVWSSNARVNMLTPDILRLMRRAGCWGIAYGIESGSQEILDFLQKGIDLEGVRRAITWTKQAGIIAKGYIMVGVPKDTRETIRETMDFVLTLDLDLLTVNHFTPFPGTLDYERAGQYGFFNKDWRLANEHSMAFVPEGLSREEVERAIREITRRFYLRPRIIKNQLHLLANPHKCALIIKGAIALMKFITQKNSTYGKKA
ncbi:MAG: cobalamin-dependent protein [Candidatus Omnitrophica bacterium]|nr:cobalamin-dependent protein [Candidatus Omnitrophota bacterium]